MTLLDLGLEGHLMRNALADHADLVAAGTSHEEALRRVGLTEEKYINQTAASKRRAANVESRA